MTSEWLSRSNHIYGFDIFAVFHKISQDSIKQWPGILNNPLWQPLNK